MRKAPNPSALRRTCMPIVCVLVGVGGGGGGLRVLSFIYIHENAKKILKLKDFEPQKMV